MMEITKHQVASDKQISNLKSQISKFCSGFLVLAYSLLFPFLVLAQATVVNNVNTDCGGPDELCHPLRGDFNVVKFLGQALQAILGLVGIIAFVMVIFGAIRWMTAGGNSENVDKGRSMMVWAFLGLALAASSFVILDFIFKGLNTALYQP
jgi:hypothetical protein